MDAHKLFKKNRQTERGGGFPLYVQSACNWSDIQNKVGDRPTESVWVKLKVGKTHLG